MTYLPKTAPELERFKKAASETIGAVSLFRDGVNNYISEVCKLRELSISNHPLYDQIVRRRIIPFAFSDSLLLYGSLANQNAYPQIINLAAILFGCAGAMILSLENHYVFRGSVEIGIGAQLKDREIYGPVLVSAYDLEKHVASYPRIVIGKGVIEYLISVSHCAFSDPIVADFIKSCINDCRSLIWGDDDGNPILDFLGPFVRERLKKLGWYETSVRTGFKFVETELTRFKQEANEKLASKYERLQNYFVKRAGSILM